MKQVPDELPEKYPKKIDEGPKMEYGGTAFPKPKPKKKKKGWKK